MGQAELLYQLEGGVAVMDEMVYEALVRYYSTLEKTGYIPCSQVAKLLVLVFYVDFVFNDYRGILSRDDYMMIGRALDCLYGTTCLIPYPDYLRMGKLNLGSMTEMAQRVKALENTKVVKLADVEVASEESDVLVMAEED